MSSDSNLVRAHFESALATLAQLRDFTSPEDHAHLLEHARLAHGAGVRRLSRMIQSPWRSDELIGLHQLEERVRRAIARAENENQTCPYFMISAAQ